MEMERNKDKREIVKEIEIEINKNEIEAERHEIINRDRDKKNNN